MIISLVFAAALVVVFVVYKALWPVQLDSQEPPVLRPKIPMIGHLLSLAQLRFEYHLGNHKKYRMQAHTLPILGHKLYVASSPQLAAAVLRARTLSFEPLLAGFADIMLGLEGPGLDMWKTPDYHVAFFKVLHTGMSGKDLYSFTKALVSNTAEFLSGLSREPTEVDDFYEWGRQVLTVAVTTDLYGAKNPLKDPKMRETFWYVTSSILTTTEKLTTIHRTFHDSMHLFLIPASRSLVASTAFKTREQVRALLETYIADENDMAPDVPQFTRDRIAIGRKFGMSPDDISRIELGFTVASLANTSAILYWLLIHIYGQPDLLARIREELLTVVGETEHLVNSQAERPMTLRLGGMKEKCPLFFSCFQETQRLTAVDNVNRSVVADTTITDDSRSYLLKSGQSVQVPLAILHRDPEVWGADFETWVGDRFLKMGEEAMPTTGFFPFGGGKHQCPGRNLARGLVMGSAAQLLLGLDVTGVDGGPAVVPKAQTPWPTSSLTSDLSPSEEMYTAEKAEPVGPNSLRERALHHISQLRYRVCVLTGLILIFLSIFWLYDSSPQNGFRLPFNTDLFYHREDNSWIDNSTRSDWVKPRPGHLIPPKIWQIMLPKNWKDRYPVNDPEKLSETATWLAMNTDYAYTLVGGKGGKEFVERRFGNVSKILQTYNHLPNVGMKSDMLRYLLLDVEGGIYTDTDTLALKPVDVWVPRKLRNETRLVVGIEFDQRDGPAWADIPHPVQFCQWTIAAAPGHPVFKKMTDRVIASVEDLVRQHGVKEGGLKPSSFEVMNSTGPAAWTDVVFQHLQTVEPSLTDIRNLSYMKAPTLYGDVLVLPIDGFGMGQVHSGSTHDGSIPRDALVKHLFGGSWRGD
ncbi:alpha-mannosyltransferase och1 [Colletotrichum karsti]|uniref:Alpha-mannosyltransferase och1 n=1 Tax=Colletotrichum karsti TaxID=1095194 RepID=A0A9P6LGA5_9PEZI|nr:alpha-mannosyltransferase och1 [Colletotrichum karsti]KAF9871981.1 alpha-mannosyltransferase och1 [Colletotrichum karsti]